MFRHPLLTQLVIALAAFGCASAGNPSRPASDLNVSLSITESSAGATIAEIVVQNVGGEPVAVCQCFGVKNAWVHLEIVGTNGRATGGPEFDVFEQPRYRCLEPGGRLVFTEQLDQWYPEMSGRRVRGAGPFSFGLEPGTYRVRASYLDDGPRVKLPCGTVTGEASSDWLSVAVPASDS
jgi:hypothetical protein